jgi:hypothetical protein
MKIQGGEEGNENKGENGVVPATDQQQRRRHGDAGADNLCQHQEVTGEIARRDADHVGQRQGGGLDEGNETPHAEQHDVRGGAGRIAALPFGGLIDADDARPTLLMPADVQSARAGDERDRQRAQIE